MTETTTTAPARVARGETMVDEARRRTEAVRIADGRAPRPERGPVGEMMVAAGFTPAQMRRTADLLQDILSGTGILRPAQATAVAAEVRAAAERLDAEVA